MPRIQFNLLVSSYLSFIIILFSSFFLDHITRYLCGTLRSWGHLRPKISLVGFCMKTNFWWLKSPKIYSLMTKNTKKCKKLSLKAFFAAIGLIWRCKKVVFSHQFVWYGGLHRLFDTPKDQTVNFPYPVDVFGSMENS